MKIELSNDYFIKGLVDKYNFETDNEGKVIIKFPQLNNDELIELVNRYFYESENGWRVYKPNDNYVIVDRGNEKTTYPIDQFRAAFNA